MPISFIKNLQQIYGLNQKIVGGRLWTTKTIVEIPNITKKLNAVQMIPTLFQRQIG
jgi:hypothetical protein